MDLDRRRRRRSSPTSRTACARSWRWRRRCCRRRACSFSTSRSKGIDAVASRQIKDLLHSFVGARRDHLPDVAHSRDRRAAVDAHRRHRQRPHRRAGAHRRRAGRRAVGKGTLEELFIDLVGGERAGSRPRLAVEDDAVSFARSCGCAGGCSSTRSSEPARATRSSAFRSRPKSSARSSRSSCSFPRAWRSSVLGLVAGFGTATGAWLAPDAGGAIFPAGVHGFTLIGPVVLPTRDGGNAVRLLLLPIPRLALYMAQRHRRARRSMGSPDGAAASDRPDRAGCRWPSLDRGIALVAGTVFLLIVIGLTSLISSAIHLVLRGSPA